MAYAIVRDGVRFWIVILGIQIERLGPFYSWDIAHANVAVVGRLYDLAYGWGYARGYAYGRTQYRDLW